MISIGNYNDVFDIKIVVFNFCNFFMVIIELIEVSSLFDLMFEVIVFLNSCVGFIYIFNDNIIDINEVVSGNFLVCIDVLNLSWMILGIFGEDWNIVSGNFFNFNSIDIEFINLGIYIIEMILVSFVCGEFIFI